MEKSYCIQAVNTYNLAFHPTKTLTYLVILERYYRRLSRSILHGLIELPNQYI